MVEQGMFSTKKHLVSQKPKISYVDEIQKAEKKYQQGPGTYDKEKIRSG
jgi:hypothetical protein